MLGFLDTAVLKIKTIKLSLCHLIRYLLPDSLSILKKRLIFPRLCFLVVGSNEPLIERFYCVR